MAAISQRRRDPRDRRTSTKQFLPATPLAEAVMALAGQDGLRTVCARIGIAERVVTRWRRGEANGNIEVNDADLVLTRLGWFWWEIWTEETVREPLFVVTTYHNVAKKESDGSYRRRRLKDRTIPYGDLGTDFWRLREISALMTGDGIEGAS